MRPSHILLLVFAVFFTAVVLLDPGRTVSRLMPAADSARVVHRWGAERPVPESVTLAARVVDVCGEPLADVHLADELSGQTTTTDAAGRFSLQVAARRRVQLVATDAQGQETRLSVLPGPEPVSLVLRPTRGWDHEPSPATSAALHGGRGLIRGGHGAVVVTVCETGESVFAEPTGHFAIPVPRAPFRLVAHDAAGNAVLSDEIAAPRADQRWMPLPDLALAPGLRFAGHLRDAHGEPLVGGTVVLRGHGEVRHLITGAGGAFGATGLVAGNYVLEAEPCGGQVGSTIAFALGAGGLQDHELFLRPEQPLRMTVVDAAGTVQPLVFVEVREVGGTSAVGQTDEAGVVTIRGLGGNERAFAVFRRHGAQFLELPVARFDADAALLVVE